MIPDGRDIGSAVHRGETRSSSINGDAGSATIWVLVGCLLLASVAVVPLGRSEVAVARHRAAVAADLAALGGARLASVDAEAACVLADRVATANGSRLVDCRRVGCVPVSAGTSLQVEVAAPLPGFARAVHSGQALAVARAGPPGCVAVP